ncbi:hypothetical protein TIFTF001_032535 [Ficus carica]|uniref:Disease resistance R13L4/SHOC-2-like LRR domain-containing protein n=1 Tax=Ficus carica TaxID=3494 RepID=A0AA88J6U5_FICCA|nr:hypothetical protein TIFTF001_032535 [Ficus carica]
MVLWKLFNAFYRYRRWKSHARTLEEVLTHITLHDNVGYIGFNFQKLFYLGIPLSLKGVDTHNFRCLDERIQRNMAQTSEGFEGYYYCRVHDLMHEIILSRADNFRFCQIPEYYSRDTLVCKLPKEIKKLQNLGHLLAYYRDDTVEYSLDSTHGVRIKNGIGSLENLQNLTNVQANGIGLIKELGKLKLLRSFAISKLTTEMGNNICAAIEKMKHLEHLRLYSTSDDETLDLQSISSPPSFLQHLVLTGQLQKLPNWLPKLQNLKVLTLSFSRLVDDPLKASTICLF